MATFGINHLRQLIEIERAGTITAAAENLHTTQPTLSRSMQRIEEELGCSLFTRTPNRVAFTPQGQAVLTFAHETLADLATLRDVLASLDNHVRPLPVQTVARGPVWALQAQLASPFPTVVLQSNIGTHQAVEQALLNSPQVLGISTAPVQLPHVASVPLTREHLMLCLPEDDPRTRKSTLPLAELNGMTLLVAKQAGHWAEALAHNAPGARLVPLDDVDRIQALTDTTTPAICTNAPQAPEAQLPGRTCVQLAGPGTRAEYWLLTRTDAPPLIREITNYIAG